MASKTEGKSAFQDGKGERGEKGKWGNGGKSHELAEKKK